MDQFDPKIHLFCTPDGRAQDRIPGDIQELATQEGTRISADMVNAWTNEIVNTIKGCGIVPDREKENQLAEAIQKRLIYDNVCKIKTYLSSTSHIPDTEVPLDGRTIYNSNYEDGLAELRRRCPSSWVSGSSVNIPNFNDYFLKFTTERTPGNTEEDMMHELGLKLNYSLNTNRRTTVEVPGPVTSSCSAPSTTIRTQLEKGPVTSRFVEFLQNPKQQSGLFQAPTTFWHIYRREDETFSLMDSDESPVTITGRITQGRTNEKNVPKNVNVIMSIVVGVPKKS